MSDRNQEIIDRLRRGYEAFSNADFDSAMEMIHPENRVLVRQNTQARGPASGIELDVDNWAVWTLDDDGLGDAAGGISHP